MRSIGILLSLLILVSLYPIIDIPENNKLNYPKQSNFSQSYIGEIINENGLDWELIGKLETKKGTTWIAETGIFGELGTTVYDGSFISNNTGLYFITTKSNPNNFGVIEILNSTYSFNEYNTLQDSSVSNIDDLRTLVGPNGTILVTVGIGSDTSNNNAGFELYTYNSSNGFKFKHEFDGNNYKGSQFRNHFNIGVRNDGIVVITGSYNLGGNSGYNLNSHIYRPDGSTEYQLISNTQIRYQSQAVGQLTKDLNGNLWQCYAEGSPGYPSSNILKVAKLPNSWNGIGSPPWEIEAVNSGNIDTSEGWGMDCTISILPNGGITIFSDSDQGVGDPLIQSNLSNTVWETNKVFENFPNLDYEFISTSTYVDDENQIWKIAGIDGVDGNFLFFMNHHGVWSKKKINDNTQEVQLTTPISDYNGNIWFRIEDKIYRTFLDSDQDFSLDINDKFPNDNTQWDDTDNDGFGDELGGTNGDDCPMIFGTSFGDGIFGCTDSDLDSFADLIDKFDDDPTQWKDTDNDGYGDNSFGNNPDAFPIDSTQWIDTDGDGYGDNIGGNNADTFPNDSTQWLDTDGDGYGNNLDGNWPDIFPFDGTQWADFDGDGYGDNQFASNADKFILDSTQWSDIDGDGYGDNSAGNNPDAFPNDFTQWSDIDGDGYGDNEFGNNPDAFPDDETQHSDDDGDGLGDNPEGNNPDPFLNDRDNDGYEDSIDVNPDFSSPGDLDMDGCLDDNDAFPSDFSECDDFDDDGIGDNEDSDDDNDGVNDIIEIQEGTDPMDASSVPVESFEIVVGGNIGLGAWDLIGIFGGIPFFSWICFGIITRNGRAERYTNQLNNARSRNELESIAVKYEFDLMIKLLGPHQGIRLERLRAELDDAIESGERILSSENQTNLVESSIDQKTEFVQPQKKPPAIPEETKLQTPSPALSGNIGNDGYEWIEHDGKQWYRTAYSNSTWVIWDK